jgi:hypothetical protein
MLPESAIENSILQYLNVTGYFSYKIPDQREFRDGQHRKHPYMPRGVPDILCVYRHKTIFFEVKRDDGRLSEYQKTMHEKMNDVYTVRSIREVQQILSLLDRLHHHEGP